MEQLGYVIDLPEKLPERLFRNAGELSRETIRRIYELYSLLPKKAATRAGSSVDALGHLVFRRLERNALTKTLLNMLKTSAKEFVFEVPELDPNETRAELVQEAELGFSIAEQRDISQNDAYPLARDLMRLYRED